MVFLSPERLTSSEFDTILCHKPFQNSVTLLRLDKVHILEPWSKDFCPVYHQMAKVHYRLPPALALVAIFASVTPGKDFAAICKALNLKKRGYYCFHLLNERPNIRSVIQELFYPLSRYHFLDIAWIVNKDHKCVMYCYTIDLGFYVAMYLWSLFEPREHRLKCVHVWNSLTSAIYNEDTLQLF